MARNVVVQNMLGQQTSFCAGRLRDYLAQWKGLTSDPIILQYVAGVKIEFKGDILRDNIIHVNSIPSKNNLRGIRMGIGPI